VPEVTERRKLPITVHTLEWDGTNSAEMFHFCGDAFRTAYDHSFLPVAAQVYDKLHDSWISVLPGQHIVRGIRGEFYPIDPDVLAETYEPPHATDTAPAPAPAPAPLLQRRTPASTCRYLAETLAAAKVSERTVTIAGVTVALGLLADRLDADTKAAAEGPEALRDANLAAVEARGETVRLARVLREIIATFNPLADHKGRVFGWQSRLALPDDFDRWGAVADTIRDTDTDTSAHESGPETTSAQASSPEPEDAPEAIRDNLAALMFNAINPVLGGFFLPLHRRQRVADALRAVVQPTLAAAQDRADQLQALIERGFDTHMQFSVLEADGTTTMLPCADWCYACKLEKAEAEVKRLRAGEEEGYSQIVDPTPGQWIRRWNQAGPEERLEVADHIMRNMARADTCRNNGHTERLAELAHLQHVHRSMLTLADKVEGEHGRGADIAERIRTILYGTVDVSGTPAAEPVQPPAEPQASAVPEVDWSAGHRNLHCRYDGRPHPGHTSGGFTSGDPLIQCAGVPVTRPEPAQDGGQP
jgi:hypothetical protein